MKKIKFNRFHFLLPFYTEKSFGIMTIWNFAYELSKYRVVTYELYDPNNHLPYNKSSKNFYEKKYNKEKNVLVFYNDSINGNPLQAEFTARYILAKPGILNLSFNWSHDNEFIFAYSKAISTVVPNMNFMLLPDSAIFDNSKIKKINKVIIYYGKIRIGNNDISNIYSLIKDFDEVYVVTRTHPITKKVLYKHIAEAKLLISLDPLSNITLDANLLGTPVYIADNSFQDSFDSYDFKVFGYYFSNNIFKLNLKNYDYDELRNNTKKVLDKFIKGNNYRIKSFLKELEIFFDSPIKNRREVAKNFDNEAFDFLKNRWALSPIYNCSSWKTVVGFHILRKSKFIFFTYLIFVSFIGRIISFIGRIKNLNLKTKVVSFLNLKHEHRVIYLYLTNPKKFSLLYEPKNSSKLNQNQQHSDYELDKDRKILPTFLIKLFWRYFS